MPIAHALYEHTFNCFVKGVKARRFLGINTLYSTQLYHLHLPIYLPPECRNI